MRLPRRMVPIWVSDPMGLAMPLRTASTPATNVVATAPMPGIMTPSLPLGGWISCWMLLRLRLCALFLRSSAASACLSCFLMASWECKANAMFSY